MASLCAAVVLSSCQTDTTGVQEDLQEASINFTIDSAYRQPDSASWNFRTKSDSCILAREPKTDNFTASFRLPAVPVEDSVRLSLWKWGMRINRLRASGENLAAHEYDKTNVERDITAYVVLQSLDAWADSDPKFFKRGAQGARRVFAKLMIGRDSLSRYYASHAPAGFDSAMLADDICVAMARAKKPFDSLYADEFPGPDSVGWREAVLARVRSGLLTSGDSAVLFPPLPVRVESPISVAGILVAGGDEVAVSGGFGWHPGMVVLDALVMSGKDTVRGNFDVALEQPWRANDTSWNLDSRATIRARSRAMGGDYRLLVVARDTARRRAVSSAAFTVKEPPEGTPRLMRWLPQGDDTVRLPFEKTTLHVEAKVFNPDSIVAETFTIGGVKAEKVGDSIWGADVPVAPTGRPTVVAMRVVGKKGYPGSDYLLVVRAIDAEPPKLVVGAGGQDREIPFEQGSAKVGWSASDNHKVDRVEIGGAVATLVGTEYVRDVPLAVGENVVSIKAVDSTGNVVWAQTKIVRRKDLEKPEWIRDFATHDSDVTSDNVRSLLLAWKVSDNHKVAKVSIGGVEADRSGELYYRRVPVVVGETRIAMVATDSTGNDTTDTVTIRKEPNPGYPVVKALTGTKDTVVPFETTTIELGWMVLNPGSLKSASISGEGLVAEDARFSRRISLAIGDTLVRFEAVDTLGAKTYAQAKVTRLKDLVPPTVVKVRSAFVTVSGTTTADVVWVVEDNHELSSVSIDGADAAVAGNQYSRKFAVAADQAWIRIVAKDSCGNETADSVLIDRTPDSKKPEIAPLPGNVSREVDAETSIVLVAWTVSDDRGVASVEIAGRSVEGQGGVYARYVELQAGQNPISIVAKDESGNEASQGVTIVRKP